MPTERKKLKDEELEDVTGGSDDESWKIVDRLEPDKQPIDPVEPIKIKEPEIERPTPIDPIKIKEPEIEQPAHRV